MHTGGCVLARADCARQRGVATQPARIGNKAACVHGVACRLGAAPRGSKARSSCTKSCFEQLEHATNCVLFYILCGWRRYACSHAGAARKAAATS